MESKLADIRIPTVIISHKDLQVVPIFSEISLRNNVAIDNFDLHSLQFDRFCVFFGLFYV